MRINTEPAKKWFGYNRKERRASIMLIILIILVLTARWVVPDSNMDIIEITPVRLSAAEDISGKSNPSIVFDPNRASFDTLIKAGFKESEAKTLINYRSKGGRFRKPSDIRKIYGLDSARAERLEQFIVIGHDKNGTNSSQRPLIDLNRCDSATLEMLPGIGPVLSARIIKYRNLLGGFVSVDQLKEVYGLPPETFERIRSRVFADSSSVRKININSADYGSLAKIPYLKRYQISDILKYREIEKVISGTGELVKNNIITDSIALKIKPYLMF